MCGICGVVEPGRPGDVETTIGMRDALAHRGPDGEGLFHADGVALGHRRLAIIDLGEGGVQPFAGEDGAVQLVYNGELYNYRELRAELEARGRRFRTASDTEVLLAAYLEWGERCVERFQGMWAFAIWDGREQRLFCSRDRFGIKPFYYRFDGRRLVFASELKAFRADAAPLEPNLAIVSDFVRRDFFDHSDETFFAGIRKLPPAHNLVCGRNGLRLACYWQLEHREPPRGDSVSEVRELFLDAVRMHLRSDVPVGTCLSGGIDSSAIACTIDLLLRTEAENARPVGERQKTFTVYFDRPGFDERPFARAVVEQISSDPHWVTFTAKDMLDHLPAIVEAQDEPFRSTSICASWYVMREAARAGVKVVLDGQGGDEVLAGYHAFFKARYRDLLGSGRLGSLAGELVAHTRVHGGRQAAVAAARSLLTPGIEQALQERRTGSRALLQPALAGLTAAEEPTSSPFPDRLRSLMTRILTVRGLPELLHCEDRNSMAHSIEARVPFLDHRLVELLFSLEGSALIRGGLTKRVLRDALADLLPVAVATRTDKLGFVTPEGHWLRGPLGELAADVFASQSFRERGLVEPGATARRLERHRRGELDAGFELWRVLNLELWARAYLDDRGRPTRASRIER